MATTAAIAARIESLECRVFLSDGPWPAVPPPPAAIETSFALPVSASLTGEPSPAPRPTVTSTTPANGATGVLRDAFVSANVSVLGGTGIDKTTLNAHTVRLYRKSDGAVVPASLNTSAGGDVLVLGPSAPLDPDTQYTFEVTSELKVLSGDSFAPIITHFTTGSGAPVVDASLKFNKLHLDVPAAAYTAVTTGPDGRLYAATETGEILRFDIAADGKLGNVVGIRSLIDANSGEPRFLTGIEFDPASTADDLVLWATHSYYAIDNAPDWTGKVTRLSGPDLRTAQDYVVGLPRSTRDHVTNQLRFGPDGAIYFPQASHTAMGAPDHAWHFRSERQLSAAILRLDVGLVRDRLASGQGPLDVKTEEGGTYDPKSAGAPLTVYAPGVRNAYDLLWHSNGKLYAPGNGSQRGGATPAGNGAPGLSFVDQVESDYLFRIEAGKYYGHPNPSRGQFVRNGGNPTSGADPNELSQYPVGTDPEGNYQFPAYDFGEHYSPNGIIEYRGGAFGGALHGKLMVARFSGGDDVVVLSVDGDGNITEARGGIQGLRNFNDPLDLTEDPRTGYLYVAEFGAERITLVRPDVPGAPPGQPSPTQRAPIAPYGLSVKPASRDELELNWIDTVGESGYAIERADSAGGTWTQVGTTAPNETRYLDTDLARGRSYTYRVRAASDYGNSEASPAASASTLPLALPAGWSGMDVGAVSSHGTGDFLDGTFELAGSGADIGGDRDAFYFTGMPAGGDIEIVARVTGVELTHGYAKAGVMIRATADAGAANAMMELTAGHGAEFQSRIDSGSDTDHVRAEDIDGPPVWMKLVRRGEIVSGYTSGDGVAWTRVSYTRVTLGEQVLVGLAVTSHDEAGSLCTATFDNVSITAATPLAAPESPRDPLAFGAGTQATLYWLDASVDETGFVIERRRVGGAWTQVAIVGAEIETYTDPYLAPSRKYEYRVRAMNAAGESESSAVASAKTGKPEKRGQTPFSGSPPSVPGLIEAEAFDEGGRGKAWRDRTPENDTGAYRDTGVDLATTTDHAGGAYHVEKASRGEWLAYTVDVPTAGVYTVDVRYAAPNGFGGVATFESDGRKAMVGSSSISLTSTGGIDVWQTAGGVIELKAGVQVLRVSFDNVDGAPRYAPVEIANVNWFNIAPADPATVEIARASVSAPLRKGSDKVRPRSARVFEAVWG